MDGGGDRAEQRLLASSLPRPGLLLGLTGRDHRSGVPLVLWRMRRTAGHEHGLAARQPARLCARRNAGSLATVAHARGTVTAGGGIGDLACA